MKENKMIDEITQRKTITGEDLMQVSWSPYFGQDRPRAKKYQSTIEAQAKGNHRRAHDMFVQTVCDNFRLYDFFVTVEFKGGTTQERIKKGNNYIRRLHTLYNGENDKLKYIKVWDRGDRHNGFHMHAIIPAKDIDKFEIVNKQNDITVHVETIQQRYEGETEKEVLEKCANYLWKKYDKLNDEDKEIIKRRYCSSGLNKLTIETKYDDCYNHGFDKDFGEQKQKIIEAKNYDEIDNLVQRLFPNWRLDSYGYFSFKGYAPYWIDDYGNTFVRLNLVRKGSRLDDNCIRRKVKCNGENILYTIDMQTGEVLNEIKLENEKYNFEKSRISIIKNSKIEDLILPDSRQVYTGAYRHQLDLDLPIVKEYYRQYTSYKNIDFLKSGKEYEHFEKCVFNAYGYR